MNTLESEAQAQIDVFNRPEDGWFDYCAKMRQILTTLNKRLGRVEKQEDKQPGDKSGDRNLDTAGAPPLDEVQAWAFDLIEQWYARDRPMFAPAAADSSSILLRDLLHHFNNRLEAHPADLPTEGGVETNIALDGLGTYTRAPGDPTSLYSPIDLTLPAALLGDVDEGDTNSERRCSTCLQWEREALRADGLVAPCPPSRTGQHHWEHWTNLVRRAGKDLQPFFAEALIGGEGGERILHPTDGTLPSDIPTSELMADYIRKSLRSDGSAVGIKIMVELHQQEVHREDRAAQRREMEAKSQASNQSPADTDGQDSIKLQSEDGCYTIIFSKKMLSLWTSDVQHLSLKAKVSPGAGQYEAVVFDMTVDRDFPRNG